MIPAAPIQLIVVDLPVERLDYQSRLFIYTKVDYFGLFYVIICQNTENSGVSLHLFDYSCFPCNNCPVHGLYFMCNVRKTAVCILSRGI